MKRLWHDVRTHWLATALFLATWVGFWAWVAIGSRRGADMDIALFMAHPALPLLAGALIGWWRWVPGTELPGLGALLAAAAAISAIDGAIILALSWRAIQPGASGIPAGPQPPPFSFFVGLVLWWLVLPSFVVAYLGWYVGSGLAQVRRGRRAATQPGAS